MNKEIDLSSYEFSRDPYPVYDALRKSGNVHYLEKNRCWLLIGFNEIRDVLTNYALFTSEGQNAFDPFLLNCDPPAHTVHRKMLAGDDALFAHTTIEKMRDANLVIATDLTSALENRKTFDLLADFAIPFSSRVILNLLGITPAYRNEIRSWTDQAALSRSIHDPGFAGSEWEKLRPLLAHWVEQVLEGRISSGLAGLVRSIKGGEKNEKELLVDLAKVLLLGGNETTPNLVSSAMLGLLNDSQLMSEVLSDRGLVPALINETLRFQAPTQLIQRVTKEDVVLGDMNIPKGSLLVLSIGAANRDPAVFDHPDTFDIRRKVSKILSFGYGPHYCIGAGLARQEALIAINRLLDCFPGLSLPPGSRLTYKHSSHVRGLERLEVYTHADVAHKLAGAKQQAEDLLRNALASYGEFPSFENYPNADPDRWHYTYPSPFIHANVLYALLHTQLRDDKELIGQAAAFLDRQKEAGDIWRFWKADVCRNPVPPDVDDLAVCSFVLEKCNIRVANKKLLYGNISGNRLLTWIRPSLPLALRAPGLCLNLLKTAGQVRPTIAGGMLDYADFELGVMANALMYLGENERTAPVIDKCIELWEQGNDSRNFYDNDLVVAYHLSRACRNGISRFATLADSIEELVASRMQEWCFAEKNLAWLTLASLGRTRHMPGLRQAIIHEVCDDGFAFTPFRYFTSKDRNFYGGSACLTAAWFLEVMDNDPA